MSRGKPSFNRFERKSFCVPYRPSAVRFSRIIDLMKSLLGFLRTQKNDCKIFCYFDVNTLFEDTEKKNYSNLLASYSYKIQTSEPTRVTCTLVSCKDYTKMTVLSNQKRWKQHSATTTNWGLTYFCLMLRVVRIQVILRETYEIWTAPEKTILWFFFHFGPKTTCDQWKHW